MENEKEERKKMMKKEKEERKKKEEKTKKLFWLVTFIVYSILFCVEYFWLSRYSETIYKMEWNWGWVIFYAQVAYTILSLKRVGATKLGALLLFGKPIRAVGSGLVFAPLGIIQLEKVTRLVIQEQYPDDPEKVWKGDQTKIPEGMMPPIRITHAYPKKSTDDPINKRMTTEVSIITRYRVVDFIQFLTTIGTIDEAKRQLRDTAVATCRQRLAKRTPAETLEEWDEININLRKAVDNLVEGEGADTRPWGVNMEDAYMEEVDLGKTVNEGLRNVPKADLDKKVTVITAEGERIKRELEGKGVAKAKRVLLDAKALGYKKIAEELKIKEKSLVIMAETARDALENSQYSLVAGSGGMADIFNIVAAIQGVLPKLKPKENKQ